jgi:hypothetical protein
MVFVMVRYDSEVAINEQIAITLSPDINISWLSYAGSLPDQTLKAIY